MWKLSKYSKLSNCSALTSSFILTYLLNNPSLHQNCPYSEFSLIRTECGEILHILMQIKRKVLRDLRIISYGHRHIKKKKKKKFSKRLLGLASISVEWKWSQKVKIEELSIEFMFLKYFFTSLLPEVFCKKKRS